RISIFVFPSVIESFGLALAEAMARGCAVVATKVGFASELTHGASALLLEAAESPKLYEAVHELILDSELRSRISQAGRQAVQHLRWKDAIAKLSDTYTEWAARTLRTHRF